ncbi:60S ribosomal protein L32 isoform X3 [Monodelphis domestica]|uniref:EF-hand calcium binding domain 12 n=1 Tax=Monodelphis domestica TaxID=13616 RepID=F7AGC0_MONDO|nr:60S ribosomal protein L32 isoform X3 [Monodelphis domestica]
MCKPSQKEVTQMRSTWFHHFKEQKKQGFKMPNCRHRIIIAPSMEEYISNKTSPFLEVDPSSQFSKGGGGPWQPCVKEEKSSEDGDEVHSWLAQRLKINTELDHFMNLDKWVNGKPGLTNLENRILRKINSDKENELAAQRAAKIVPSETMKPVRRVRKCIPLIRLPEPLALEILYNHLLKHKVKVFELFAKGDWEHQKISREEFVDGMKKVNAPLTEREFEDVVIYLSSMNKFNVIYLQDLVTSYRYWSASRKNEKQEKRKNYLYGKKRPRRKSKAKKEKSSSLRSPSPQSNLLEVPPVNTAPDRMLLSYEDMEEVGKRYREMRRQNKKKINPLIFVERCRLVRSGNKAYDDNNLPSTLSGEMGELTDAFRQATFLVYLKSVKACEDYQIPLTEDILMKALLFPGDKLIFEKGNILKIRQPGGYYDELKEMTPTLDKWLTVEESPALKKSQKPIKKMTFKEFETLTRKLKDKCLHKPYGPQGTHPNFFWPGHLLDKLLIYLPNKKWERQLVLFSRVDKLPHAYPAIYHPERCWPISDAGYVVSGQCNKKSYC